MDQVPPVREATEPNRSAVQRAEDACNPGDSMVELKRVAPRDEESPAGYRTVPTPSPREASTWAAAGATPAVPTSNASTPRFTGGKLRAARR